MTQIRHELVKFDKSILEEIPEIAIKEFTKKLTQFPLYSRGLLYMPYDLKTIKIGYDGDDFTRNVFTVSIGQKVHRVPRIFSKLFHAKRRNYFYEAVQ